MFRKRYYELLGKQVFPLVRSDISVDDSCIDKYDGGNHRWPHAKGSRQKLVSQYNQERRDDYKTQKWYVNAIRMDGTFDLLSEYGYQEIGVDRKSFRVIKNGDHLLTLVPR